MILHDVSDDPEFVEISSAAFRSKWLLECDLDIGNMLTGPCCSEKGVGETQNQKIFYHFFAKVVIDTECLYQHHLQMRDLGPPPHSRSVREQHEDLVKIEDHAQMVFQPKVLILQS